MKYALVDHIASKEFDTIVPQVTLVQLCSKRMLRALAYAQPDITVLQEVRVISSTNVIPSVHIALKAAVYL